LAVDVVQLQIQMLDKLAVLVVVEEKVAELVEQQLQVKEMLGELVLLGTLEVAVAELLQRELLQFLIKLVQVVLVLLG
jgi:hypothetical protein